MVLVSNRQPMPVDEDELARVAERALAREGRRVGELSLSFVTPEEMADLHVTYMDEEGPTDVLSFPMDEDGLLGDVVVCPAEAARNNPDLAAELRLLVVHGVLHLLGYDHAREDDRRVMWERQAAYTEVST
ncbi:MAG TPA: rRNA maturation RNase YbeY [Actinomycetota bacterium]|jgi:probable rRNA maturation factor|nr:rRNA maturation RNase YbeY [Actinomycetota bacterium]